MRLSKRRRMPKIECMGCGKGLDAVSAVDSNNRPSPGDFSMCIYCGHVMIYCDDGTLRKPTESELVDIAGDELLIEMRRVCYDIKPEVRH